MQVLVHVPPEYPRQDLPSASQLRRLWIINPSTPEYYSTASNAPSSTTTTGILNETLTINQQNGPAINQYYSQTLTSDTTTFADASASAPTGLFCYSFKGENQGEPEASMDELPESPVVEDSLPEDSVSENSLLTDYAFGVPPLPILSEEEMEARLISEAWQSHVRERYESIGEERILLPYALWRLSFLFFSEEELPEMMLRIRRRIGYLRNNVQVDAAMSIYPYTSEADSNNIGKTIEYAFLQRARRRGSRKKDGNAGRRRWDVPLVLRVQTPRGTFYRTVAGVTPDVTLALRFYSLREAVTMLIAFYDRASMWLPTKDALFDIITVSDEEIQGG